MAYRRKIISFILIILFAATAFIAWRLFGTNTDFPENKKNFYIKTGSSFSTVVSQLIEEKIISNPVIFKMLAHQLKYDVNIKAGKYTIESGSSMYTTVKILKSGRQTPVKLVITKLRTKEDLAQKIGNNFECDSAAVMALLNNNDSLLQFGIDSNTVMTAVIPNTYSILWNTVPAKIFRKLDTEQEKFWTTERKQKAALLNLSVQQVYTLASIVEEESNKEDDKGKIASVYLNRLHTGMRLSADPTVIFALKDFTIKRVYKKYTEFPSPFNTYLNNGLPPGPICTPSVKTIDAVLNAPSTNYLYFVAQPNLTGYSNFAVTYNEHMGYAKQYQQWLTAYLKNKQAADSTK